MTNVYIVRNKETGAVYVGCAMNPVQRWAAHRTGLRHNKHPNIRLQADWVDFGESSFEIEVVEANIPHEDQVDRERWWIDHFRLDRNALMYNLTFRPLRSAYGFAGATSHVRMEKGRRISASVRASRDAERIKRERRMNEWRAERRQPKDQSDAPS